MIVLDKANLAFRKFADPCDVSRCSGQSASVLTRSNFLAIWAISMVALFVRSAPRLLSPQLWAEDGRVFLETAYRLDFAHTLIASYAGYLNLLPRAISELSTLLPLAWAPIIFVWATFIIIGLTLWAILDSETPLPFKLACAIAFPLSVGTQEIYLNLTNLQWFLAPYVLSAIIRRWNRLDLFLFPLALFTGPFALIAVAALVGYRLLVWVDDRTSGRAGYFLIGAFVLWSVVCLISGVARKIDNLVVTALASYVFKSPAESAGATFVAITLLGPALAWTKLSRLDRYLYVFFVVYWLAIGYKFTSVPAQPIFASGASRYFFVPEIIGLYAVLRLITVFFPARLFPAFVGGVGIAMALAQFIISPLWPISGSYAGIWLPQVESYEAGKSTKFIHPPDWTFELPVRSSSAP